MGRIGFAATAALVLLSSCKPPATDDMLDRGGRQGVRETPMTPIASPDTAGAIWARSADGERLLYGTPGERPTLALLCDDDGHALGIDRYVATDPQAKALMALIGNGHIARLPIDAAQAGDIWFWRGRYAIDDPDLDVLRGRREVELTIPGAGSVILNPSAAPAEFIDRCRSPRPTARDRPANLE
ncbi:MAG: hypothetical protein WA908_10120 [Pontixanthobacter sp.]